MIVPRYWAEARVQQRHKRRQVTVRRFGWSDASQEAAQAHAEARAREAMERVQAGEKLAFREPKIPYNGAAGVPIREEILSEHEGAVITRNAYGAECLNTPHVLFADVDFGGGAPLIYCLPVWLGAAAGAAACGWLLGTPKLAVLLGLAGLALGWVPGQAVGRLITRSRGGPQPVALRRVRRFVAAHPDWNLRVYQTPAGLRVVATHRTFKPAEAEVEALFQALGTDPVYARMCRNQQCFRARLTPKPWRVGLEGHLKPRPGVWPVAPGHLPLRAAWVAKYEAASAGHAACAFLDSVGSGAVDPAVAPVLRLHDERSGAMRSLPIA